MVDTMLGKTFRWWEGGWYDDNAELFEPKPWRFEPVHMAVDHIKLTLVEGPHAGRSAIQRIYYQRVAPNVEITTWCEQESGSVLNITWYLDSHTTHRVAVVPHWLTEDLSLYIGDSQDPEFRRRLREAAKKGSVFPSKVVSDTGYFELL
ncbi:hypothetical protein [Rudaeicoccus suwonensis]|uniref:Phenolic acid decarboxylase n=1 Tax=Rudaeicoccus suwonensis TaxID=657409 RepID=A0A561E451_9MICO|nr:hypothetical protein [Rudaeicoccus suwonensis]TWE10361.1 hypothetical protein BKA23_2720 [Rudaeicoccus suwonensis]